MLIIYDNWLEFISKRSLSLIAESHRNNIKNNLLNFQS